MYTQLLLTLWVILTPVLTQQVTTPMGTILGSTLTTRLGKTIHSFRGIRYAKPPINDLRFKPPVPVDPWDTIYNATTDGPACPQPTDDPISEDCLLLNVYTTKLPVKDQQNSKRPVIIYLHSGGFYSVTGRSRWTGPQYLMDQNIVLVTLNYRLGSLGFLSTGTSDATGNNGLKDQVVALKWVQKNIEVFGGDPKSVTLFGYSAGAMSVSLHLVSPMSRGLFHRGIIGSASSLGQVPVETNQLQIAQKQARIVGCPDMDPKEMVACLRGIPAEILGNSLPEFAVFGNDPVLIWAPVLEVDQGQGELFLTEHPIKSILNGNFQKVPILAGVTKDEFAGRAFPVANNRTALTLLDKEFEILAPIVFLYGGTNGSSIISQRLRQFYLGESPLTIKSLAGLIKLYGDGLTGFEVNRAVKLIAKTSNNPVFYYQFTFQGRYSHFYLPGSNGTPYGVVHHDDLIYLFFISPMFPYFKESDPESKMVTQLTTLWVNFATTGNPDPEGIKWEPYNDQTQKYMEIGAKLTLKEKLFEQRYSLWEEMFPLSNYQ